jgi:hypothetical protein
MTIMEERLNKDELERVIKETTARIMKVAEVVDQVFPDKGMGEQLKESASRLCGHVNSLTNLVAQDEMDNMLIDDLPIKKEVIVTVDELKIVATNECSAIFKMLETTRNKINLSTEDLRAIEVLGTHARGLLSLLLPR